MEIYEPSSSPVSTIKLVQDDNVIDLIDDEIAAIVAARYHLEDFRLGDLIAAIQKHEMGNGGGGVKAKTE